MDIYLDDFPYPEYDKEDLHDIQNSHYYYGEFSALILKQESRRLLRKAIGERALAYRKDCRESREIWIKAGGVLIGIVGTLTGLVAVFIKTKAI